MCILTEWTALSGECVLGQKSAMLVNFSESSATSPVRHNSLNSEAPEGKPQKREEETQNPKP